MENEMNYITLVPILQKVEDLTQVIGLSWIDKVCNEDFLSSQFLDMEMVTYFRLNRSKVQVTSSEELNSKLKGIDYVVAYVNEQNQEFLNNIGVPVINFKSLMQSLRKTNYGVSINSVVYSNQEYLDNYESLRDSFFIDNFKFPSVAIDQCLLMKSCIDIELKDKSLDELLTLSKTRVEPTHLTFGKYRGKSIKEVAESDRGYLEWLVGSRMKQHPRGDSLILAILKVFDELDTPF